MPGRLENSRVEVGTTDAELKADILNFQVSSSAAYGASIGIEVGGGGTDIDACGDTVEDVE